MDAENRQKTARWKWLRHIRPKCKKSEDGTHTMIEYESLGTKVCHDCQYSEKIITMRTK